MDTLTSAPVADVLDRLFDEAKAADGPLEAQWAQALNGDDDSEIAQLLAKEAADYRGVYRDFADNFLNVSAEFGRFLYVCARARRAKHVVEFGTSFGVSTIHLAVALRDGGGGRLISTELEPTKAARAQRNLADAGVADLVDIRVGDALETLTTGIDGPVDLVLLDGAWSLYLPVLKLLEPHLDSGALIIGENALDEASDYLGYVRNPANGYRSMPLPFDPGRGNEISVRTA
jgi:predicted O-methyltransferase YrrM